MMSYKALVAPNTKVYFSASSDDAARVIASLIKASKLIKQISPVRHEFLA
jgi:L-lactate utilization protein LutB